MMKKKEPIRYIENAKEILRKSPVEDNYYTDMKYVKAAFGCGYLGVLKAMDEFLISRGIEKRVVVENNCLLFLSTGFYQIWQSIEITIG